MNKEYDDKRGYCKKCEDLSVFEFVSEYGGLLKWKCVECGNIQIG